MQDRKRLTPVPLPAKEPGPQFVIDLRLAQAAFFQPSRDPLLELRSREATEFAGIHRRAVTDERFGQMVERAAGLIQPIFRRAHDGANRQSKLLGELKVA